LNVVKAFQGVVIIIHTKVEWPSSPTLRYYVKMPCSPTTPTTNRELVVNLKDPYLESNDLNVSYQTQQVLALANLLFLPRLPTRKTFGKEPLVDYFSSHVVTFDKYLVVLKQKVTDKEVTNKVR